MALEFWRAELTAPLEIKSTEDDRRLIRGIATTPTQDRMGDVIDPLGVTFKNPLPLLLDHNAKEPIGTVELHEATATGIEFTAHIPRVESPASLKESLDRAYASIKHGLRKGASIGFRVIESAFNKETGGFRFLKTEVLELSLVAVPANQDAAITMVKSALVPPAPGPAPSATPEPRPAPRARVSAPIMKTSLADQILSFEGMVRDKSAKRDALIDAASEGGVTFDAAQKEEYRTLEAEIADITDHLGILRARQEREKAAAVPVVAATPEDATRSRAGVIRVTPNVYEGAPFTRMVMALAATRGNRLEAAQFARKWKDSTPEVITALSVGPITPELDYAFKAAVTAGTTTDSDWAAPLVVYQNVAGNFVEYLTPRTVIGRIANLQQVPFHIQVPVENSLATVGWVGEGKPKPVGEITFSSISLGMAKAAGIVAITEELARSSQPSAETVVRNNLTKAITKFLDEQFLDPAKAAVANVSPASITNGVTPVAATGTDYTAMANDITTLLNQFAAANLSAADATWVMRETQAQSIAMMKNALGAAQEPAISATGGMLVGLPVVSSQAVPSGMIALVKGPEIYLADEGGVNIDVSREASVQMNTTPDDPATATTVLFSFWQNNAVGIRVERFITWGKARAQAVGYISGANYH